MFVSSGLNDMEENRTMKYLIGIDVGTSGTKALAIDRRGRVAASATIEYPLSSPRPNWAEQDPADWWAATVEALRRLAAEPKVKRGGVESIGLTGQMHGSVFLDKGNTVLRPAILWCDQRTAAECDQITKKVGPRKLIKLVCNPALTGFTAPKILWLRKHERRVYDRVDKVLLPKDYIRLKLTGQYATDVSDASGTLLFDVPNRRWSKQVLDILEIPADWMPPAYEGPEVTGELLPDVAETVGLRPGIPVVAGGGDQAAGAVGTGVVRSGVISATVGTSGVVFAFSDEVKRDPRGRVHTFCHAVPGKWHVMGVMLSAGGSLQWYRNQMCAAEREIGALSGIDPYEYITAEADTVPPGCDGLVFLPYLTGERTPHADPDAKGVFFGLSLMHTKAHMSRAVLEGVAFGMRDSLEIMRGMDIPVDQIRASGGGARSSLWRSIQADVNGAPMVTVNVDEGPAYGAALLAGVGTGVFGTVEEACDATVRVVKQVEPDPDRAVRYDRIYKLYRNLYPALQPHFKALTKIIG